MNIRCGDYVGHILHLEIEGEGKMYDVGDYKTHQIIAYTCYKTHQIIAYTC